MKKKIINTLLTIVIVSVIFGIIIIALYMDKGNIQLTSDEVRTSCEKAELSYSFVKAVELADDEKMTQNKIDQLHDLFKEYDDPYPVLMIYRYGKNHAVELTNNFENYIDNSYVDEVWDSQSLFDTYESAEGDTSWE